MSLYLGTHKIAGNGLGVNVVSCTFEEYMRIPHDPDTLYVTPEPDFAPYSMLSDYLPLSGGTMTGGIKLAAANWADLQTRDPDTHGLHIGVGENVYDGGTIVFRPPTTPADLNGYQEPQGAVELFASTSPSQLARYTFYPDGLIQAQVQTSNSQITKIIPLTVNGQAANSTGNIQLNTITLTFYDFQNTPTTISLCSP